MCHPGCVDPSTLGTRLRIQAVFDRSRWLTCTLSCVLDAKVRCFLPRVFRLSYAGTKSESDYLK